MKGEFRRRPRCSPPPGYNECDTTDREYCGRADSVTYKEGREQDDREFYKFEEQVRSRNAARGRSEMLAALVKDPPSNEADILRTKTMLLSRYRTFVCMKS